MNRILHYTIQKEDAGSTVGRFLRARGYSRHLIIQLKETADGITVNNQWAYVGTPLFPGDQLTIHIREENSSSHIVPAYVPFSIIYEDEDILVVDKPADTPVHPSQNNYDNTLANGIIRYYEQKGESCIYRCINRLDRDTTGLLIVAKHALSAAILSRMMTERKIRRTYLALTEGAAPLSGTVDAPIGRKEGSAIERCINKENGDRAVTHYHRLFTDQNISLLMLRLETGRTHQIRVHMKHLGHPLLGDYLYHPEDTRMKRTALHSYALSFSHPLTGRPLNFTAPLPGDMGQLLPTGFEYAAPRPHGDNGLLPL